MWCNLAVARFLPLSPVAVVGLPRDEIHYHSYSKALRKISSTDKRSRKPIGGGGWV